MPPVGFIGLDTMGAPIAAHLLASGAGLVVLNRSAASCAPLAAAGAQVAGSGRDVLARADPVVFMLTDEPALDQVLGRS